VFVLGKVWQLCGEQPILDDRENLLKMLMVFLGIGLAGTTWIAGISAPLKMRAILILVSLTAIAYYAVAEVKKLTYTGNALTPPRVENGRWSHEALGLSFDVPPNTRETIARPQIITSDYRRSSRDHRLRLWPNERAVFSELEYRSDRSGSSTPISSIRVEALRCRFTAFSSVVASVHQLQTQYSNIPGVKVIKKSEFSHRNGIDFAEIECANEQRNLMMRVLFARSGEFMLFFHFYSPCDQEPIPYQKFFDSIRITQRRTSFSD
jgi:hypothetical protein